MSVVQRYRQVQRRQVERLRLVHWQSSPYDADTNPDGYNETTGEFTLPVNLRNVVALELQKCVLGQPGYWFSGGTLRFNKMHTARCASTATVGVFTYSNGASGVGATLTQPATTGAISVDGTVLALNDVVLLRHQANAAHNGLYKYTTVAVSGTTAGIFTRAVDMDEANEFRGAKVTITEGATLAGQSFACTNTTTVVVGTTGITFDTYSDTTSGANIVLTAGNLTAAAVASTLQTALQVYDDLLTVTYSSTLETLTFSSTAQAFTLNFSTSDLSYSLGFGATAGTRATSTSSASPYAVTAPGAVDLSVGIHAYLTCEALRKHYVNTDVVDTIPIVEEDTVVDNNNKPVRLFNLPEDRITTLVMKLQTRKHDGTFAPYVSQNRTFGFTFACHVLTTTSPYEPIGNFD